MACTTQVRVFGQMGIIHRDIIAHHCGGEHSPARRLAVRCVTRRSGDQRYEGETRASFTLLGRAVAPKRKPV